MKYYILGLLFVNNLSIDTTLLGQEVIRKTITIPCDSISYFIKIEAKELDVFTSVLNQVETGKLKIFYDERFMMGVSAEHINDIINFTDSITIIDPETFNASYRAIKSRVDQPPAHITCFYKLVIEDQFNTISDRITKVIGLAPVWQTLDDFGRKKDKTLFWVALF